MMIDLHTHTVFCDGKNTPEEMVLSAIEKNIDVLGIAFHSYVPFDEGCCIKKDSEPQFIEEISKLKEKYKNKISILCGVEQDFHSGKPQYNFDYVIGSVHYLEKEGEHFSIDMDPALLKNLAKRYYEDDIYALIEEYYQMVAIIPSATNANVIGHFDLVSKFNEAGSLFDEQNPRYIRAYRRAIDRLISYNIPFEINTGAISRKYRTTPYPSRDIIEYIKEKGGKFILSSDSHSKENLGFMFKECKQMADELGIELQENI